MNVITPVTEHHIASSVLSRGGFSVGFDFVLGCDVVVVVVGVVVGAVDVVVVVVVDDVDVDGSGVVVGIVVVDEDGSGVVVGIVVVVIVEVINCEDVLTDDEGMEDDINGLLIEGDVIEGSMVVDST